VLNRNLNSNSILQLYWSYHDKGTEATFGIKLPPHLNLLWHGILVSYFQTEIG